MENVDFDCQILAISLDRTEQSREGRRGGERRGEEMRGKAQESRKEGIVMFREWHEWKRFPLVVCSRLAVVTR